MAYDRGMQRALLLLTLALAACARPALPSDADLMRVIAGRAAGPAQSCLPSGFGESLRAVDPSTLAYGSGRTVYINRLGASCPGLQDFSTIVVENASSQYCRGDRIRPIAPGAIIPGPTCNLGEWVPYRTP